MVIHAFTIDSVHIYIYLNIFFLCVISQLASYLLLLSVFCFRFVTVCMHIYVVCMCMCRVSL